MRRLFFILSFVAVSCSVAVDEPVDVAVDERVFHGVIAEDNTRVFLDEQIRLRWNADDRITLLEGTTRNKQYKFMGEDGDNAGDFEFVKAGFGTGNDLDRYYALYPYASTTKYKYGEDGADDYLEYTLPATQSYVAGSVGKDANVMVAVTQDLDDFDLTFRNACSFLLVRLWGAEQSVGSITVTANGGEALSGKCHIVPVYGGTPTLTMASTVSSVMLSCSEGVAIGSSSAEATDFWVVLPPATYSEGITVKVTGFYGGEQSYVVGSSLTFKRNEYKRLVRELSIASSGAGMGVGGWGDGENIEGEI